MKDALRDPANLAAALGYYRATLGDGYDDPALADVQAAAQHDPPQPTLYLHGADDGCIGAEVAEVAAAQARRTTSRSRIVDGLRSLPPRRAPGRGQRRDPRVPVVS